MVLASVPAQPESSHLVNSVSCSPLSHLYKFSAGALDSCPGLSKGIFLLHLGTLFLEVAHCYGNRTETL
jgi:hypothetical protein